MKTKEAIDVLIHFNEMLGKLYKNDYPLSLRSEINQALPIVKRIVSDTGTSRSMTIAPPPMIGGKPPVRHVLAAEL